MIEPHVHIAYAPHGAGVLHAVLWFAEGRDIYGWYAGTRDGDTHASYFMLPNYYADQPDILYRSVQDDVYGHWVEVGAHGATQFPHPPPVAETLCHELARMQDEFVRHWLFFDDDPDADHEAHALREQRLTVRHLNIRAERLGRLDTLSSVWRYDSPGADRNVLIHLSRRWQLEELTH
ncbi:MAG TPA: hypothetical protein VFP68_06600 [Burkholderiaceae bacterium]|nr:hypothetical protein [Burkholderiaceae bacterium]